MQVTLEPRAYQKSIADSILPANNSLVVLPTGLGKTLIALLVLREKIREGKCVILAPTKPLAKQHLETILKLTDVPAESAALISGEIPPAKRAQMWSRQVCISTPQTLKNDLEAGRTKFDFVYVLLDEAHRAVGNYAYTYIADKAHQASCLVVGLTASPGSDRKKIQGIVDALQVSNVQIRTEEDPDVKPYLQEMKASFIPVRLPPELLEIKKTLHEFIKQESETLYKLGYPVRASSKKALLEMRSRLFSSKSPSKYGALSHYSTLFNLIHLSELLETQGVRTFENYLNKLKGKEQTKATLRILENPKIRKLAGSLHLLPEHPKLKRLVELVLARPHEKIIVFVQYRDQISQIVKEFQKHGILAERFVGKKEGVTRKEQEETIARFRGGSFQVLVASSIGEEGLDIPAVDTVIFFEPIPSAIRTIQRRGRAGRAKAGSVLVLFTENTKDEAFFWSARKKEKDMKRIVRGMQNLRGAPPPLRSQPPILTEHSQNPRPLKTQDPQDPRPQEQDPRPKRKGQTRMEDFI